MKARFTKKLYGTVAMMSLLLISFRGTAQFGNALSFTQASSQYVTVPHSSSLNLGATFTLEAVVNYSGTNSTIVDKGNYDFLWQLGANQNAGKMGFYNASTSAWVYSTTAVPQYTSTHVAVVGSGGTVTFYINGVASGSGTASARQDNQAMTIGRQQPSPGGCQCNHMNGTINELRIWNVARTQAQIQSGVSTTIPANSAGLVAYYKFDEGSGTTTADATGNGNNGTLINGPTWVASSLQYNIPGTYTYTVPAGVVNVSFKVWGGGSGAFNSGNGISGAGGGFAQSVNIPVAAGTVFTIVVGAGGISGSSGNIAGGSSDVKLSGTQILLATGGAGLTLGTGSGANQYLSAGYNGGQPGVSTPQSGFTYFGGGGASGGTGGNGANGASGNANGDGTANGGTPNGLGGAGGKGGWWFAGPQTLGTDGSFPGGGAGGPSNGSFIRVGGNGQVTITECQTPGTIGSDHTVPFPYELATDSVYNLISAGSVATPYAWEQSTNNTTWVAAPGNITTRSYGLPTSSPQLEMWYRRRATNSCAVPNFTNPVLIKTFSLANQKLNGTIEGFVYSTNGTGVDGITVTAQKTISLLGSPISKIYTVTTSGGGKFSFQNVFYGDAANGDPGSTPFRVTASKTGHTFSPPDSASLSGTNPTSPGHIITDSTVYSLTGTVTQTCLGCEAGFTTGGIDSIKITPSKGQLTFPPAYSGDRGLGGYGITLTDPGSYILTPTYKNHTFSPATLSANVVNGDIANLNFTDNSTRTISGTLRANCNEVIGSAQLEFTDTITGRSGFRFKRLVNTDASGNYTVSLPARRYKVRLLNFTASGSDQLSQGDVLTFFNTRVKDSMIVDIDTLPRTFNLIYHRAPVLQIANLPDTSFAPYALFRQGKAKTFIVNVFEGNPGRGCKVATDTTKRIKLTTTVQGEDIDEVIQHGQVNGADTITLIGGSPNIIGPNPNLPGDLGYLKHFSLAYTDTYGRPADSISRKIVVLGVINDPGTFTTVSPQIPLMVLHHPPGDQSYSYWQSNQSNETAMRFYAGKTEANGGFIEAKLGTRFMLGFGYTSEVSIWGTLNFAQNVSARVNNATEAIITTTNSSAYSTAQNSGLGGSDGDVYIGTALNLLYARAHELKYVSNQTLGIEDKLAVAENGFATNYIYSEAQIRNVVIPALQEIVNNPTVDQAIRDKNRNQASVWQQVLDNNAANKARAAFDANYTFDGGDGPIDRSTTTSASKSNTIEFTMEVDRNFAVGLGLEIAGIGVSGGFNVNMKLETGNSTTTTSTNSTTIGYVLDDDDLFDSYTVDVKKDPVYNTPVFAMVAGTTSCPPERPGQSRDAVLLTTPQPVQTNVPANGEATFNLVVSNVSESNETRDYNLTFDAGTANGAIVTIAGAPAAGLVVPLPGIAYLGSRTVTVKVKKDQSSNVFSYENLRFTAYDNCMGGVSKSTTISAYFASPCSEITLAAPANSWVVSSGNNNLLSIQMSGYTVASLQSVELQHTNAGSDNWITDTTLNQAQIINPTSTALNLNLAGIADGNYDLRLKLVCASGIVYSQRVTGIIDRKAPLVFGIPEPTDNSYIAGDVISITYNELINTSNLGNSQVKLRKVSDNTLIAIQVSGYQNKIIVTTVNPIASMTGQNIQLIVTNVADIYGNIQTLADTSLFVVGTTVTGTGPTAISLSSVKSSQLENFADSMDVRFTVTSPASYDRLVNFTISGTATYNEDYTVRFPNGQPVTSSFNGAQGKITILANTNQVTLRIKPIKDNVPEPDETVTITLAEGGNYLIGSVYSKMDTIRNDDLSKPVVIRNGPTNICAGQTLTLSTNSTIDGQLVYSYYWDNGMVNNSNQSFNVTSPGTYILTVYTANGFSGVSDPINVTISSLPAPVLGSDVTVYKDCFGETTNLNTLFSTSGFTINWNTGNTVAALPGTYRLVASNSAGCTDTAFANVILEVATWTGAISNNWNIAGNWSINKIPSAQTHVIIATNTPNPCIINTMDAVAASIQIRNGATLRAVSNQALKVNGKCLVLPPN